MVIWRGFSEGELYTPFPVEEWPPRFVYDGRETALCYWLLVVTSRGGFRWVSPVLFWDLDFHSQKPADLVFLLGGRY